MTRALARETVIDSSGQPINAATVYVREPGTTTAIAQTMYTANTGTGTKTNPLTTGVDGKVEFYLDVSQRVDFFVTATGMTSITVLNVPVLGDVGTIKVFNDGSAGMADASKNSNNLQGEHP